MRPNLEPFQEIIDDKVDMTLFKNFLRSLT